MFSLQPFIACARELRRVRIDESIIWEPMLTTSPPSSAGSTARSTVTSRPTRGAQLLLELVDLLVGRADGRW